MLASPKTFTIVAILNAACLIAGLVGAVAVGRDASPVRVVASNDTNGAGTASVDLDTSVSLPPVSVDDHVHVEVTVPTPTVPPAVTIPKVVSTLLPPLSKRCKDDRKPDAYGLWVADVDRGSVCQIADDKVIGSVSFSPDGEQIVFTAQDGSVGDGRIPPHLYVVNADGSNLRQLDPSAEQPRQASWSPDGRWLAYTRWPVDQHGDSAIMLMRWATGELREIGRIDQGSSNLEWSPDSRTIAATEWNTRAVLTVTTDGNVTRVPYTAGGFPYMCSWSPDGSQLVVSGERGPVIVTDATGANARTLVADGRFARWSPSGSFISVWREFSAYVVQPDGTDLREVRANDSPINWSSDGAYLALSVGVTGVDVMKIADGSVTEVARGTTALELVPAAWSKAGHRLSIVVERSAHYRY